MSENNESKQKKPLKIILIVVILLVVIAVGGFFGYKIFISKNKSQPSNMPQNVPVNSVQNQGNANYVLVNPVSAFTYDLDEFLINLADEDGKRYLKTKIVLGYDEKKLLKELDKNKPIIRDSINTVLRSKKVKDFDQKGVDNIKKEILDKINPMFQKGRINNVYFNDILVQ